MCQIRGSSLILIPVENLNDEFINKFSEKMIIVNASDENEFKLEKLYLTNDKTRFLEKKLLNLEKE